MDEYELEKLKKSVDDMKEKIDMLEFKIFALEGVPIRTGDRTLKTAKEVFCD